MCYWFCIASVLYEKNIPFIFTKLFFFSEKIIINHSEPFLPGIYFSYKGYSLLKPVGNFTFSFILYTINIASDTYADSRRNRVKIKRNCCMQVKDNLS